MARGVANVARLTLLDLADDQFTVIEVAKPFGMLAMVRHPALEAKQVVERHRFGCTAGLAGAWYREVVGKARICGEAEIDGGGAGDVMDRRVITDGEVEAFLALLVVLVNGKWQIVFDLQIGAEVGV